jgi:hypothetical protein
MCAQVSCPELPPKTALPSSRLMSCEHGTRMRGRASACVSPQTTVRVERGATCARHKLFSMSRTSSCTHTHRWCAGRESTPEETQLHTIVWGYCDDNNPLLSHPRALYHPQHHHDQPCPAQPALTLFPAFIQSSQPDNTFYNLNKWQSSNGHHATHAVAVIEHSRGSTYAC